MNESPLKPGWKVWRFNHITININVRIAMGEATKLVFKHDDIIFGRRRTLCE